MNNYSYTHIRKEQSNEWVQHLSQCHHGRLSVERMPLDLRPQGKNRTQ